MNDIDRKVVELLLTNGLIKCQDCNQTLSLSELELDYCYNCENYITEVI